MTSVGVSLESDRKALLEGKTFVEIWISKIEAAIEDRKEWTKRAQAAVDAYESEKKGRAALNFWHSNVETVVPALYNSTPVPNCKRRFGDRDEVARLGSEMLERTIVFSLDQFKFDDDMLDVVRDEWLTGRGASRVRYNSTTVLEKGPDGSERWKKIAEEVFTELVVWNRWGHGPARRWEHVDWIWFDHDLTRDEVEQLMMPDKPVIEPYVEPPLPDTSQIEDAFEVQRILQEHDESAEQAAEEYRLMVEEAFSAYEEEVKRITERINELPFRKVDEKKGRGKEDERGAAARGIMQTISAFEVWCKKTRKVYFITKHSPEAPLSEQDDPLGLKGFFPIPQPLCTVRKASALEPVVAYHIAQELYEEADEVTRRIRKLIKQCKVRGLMDGSVSEDLDVVSKLDDGQYAPTKKGKDLQAGATNGIEKYLYQMPLEPIVVTLKQLYEQREQLKQLIYEVTGISDIMRGASDPYETLGAQKIKASWGSQRVQRQQGDVARYAVDLFRMFSEIITSKFEWQYLKKITSMDFAPKPVDPSTIQTPQPGVEAIGANGGPSLDSEPESVMGAEEVDPAVAQAKAAEAQQAALAQAEQAAAEEAAELEAAVRNLLQSDLLSFKIDIESDSTIRADLQRDQEQMNNFLNGTGQFWSAAIPAVQAVPQFLPHFTRLYGMFTSKFRLGKQCEDILEEMRKTAEQWAANPPAQNPGPSPEEVEAMKAESDAKIEVSRNKIQESREKTKATVLKAQGDQQKVRADMERDQLQAFLAPQLNGRQQQEQ